jgi:hypothetical protein
MATVGTCGNCGGPVEVPDAWYGTVPPIPTCRSCGATMARPFGPTLPMNPPMRGRGERKAEIIRADTEDKTEGMAWPLKRA